MLTHVIVDFFGTEPFIVCNEDGHTLYFDTNRDALNYAQENLQKGYFKIVEVSVDEHLLSR